MKTRLIIILFLWCLTSQAQQINIVEYFFDADPGFGNASQIVVNSTSLDSAFSFSVAALPAGLHTLYVRIKNSNDKWSTVYQNNVLIVNGTAGAAQIIKAEYFYDTDPGFGNGTIINLSNASLDSTLSFSVNGLTAGAHSLFVRLQNSNNNWGTTYENNFLVWPGSSGTPQIQTLQYFIDTVANSVQVPLNLSSTLDTTVSVHITDNGTDVRKLGLRLKNNTGETGNVTLADISLCNLYSPDGKFRSVRFGNSYTFIDNSLYNPSKKIKWLVENIPDTNYNDSKIFNYTFPAGFHGYKTIQQITGSGCRLDTIYKQVAMEGIESYSPDRGLLGNDFILNLFGGDLDTATTQVFLQHGSTIVYPYDKTAYQNKLLSLIFDFHTIPPSTPTIPFDQYDIHIHFASGYDTTILHAVTIGTLAAITGCNDLPGPQLISDHRPRCSDLKYYDGTFVTANLAGPERIRVATWNYYTLNVTNVGNVLAKETPVYVLVPSNYDVKFDIDWHVNSPLDTLSVDSLAMDYYQAIDTIINGQAYQYKMYMLIPPYLTPGQTLPIDFKIRTSQIVPGKIICFVERPMFGSTLKAKWLCAWDIMGYLPLTGCWTSAWDFGAGQAGFPPGYKSDFRQGILRGAFKDLMNGARNVAGVGASCLFGTYGAGKVAGAKALKIITRVEGKFDKVNNTYANDVIKNCRELDYPAETITFLTVFFSGDPNNITGNNDYDTLQHFINNYSPQHYKVTFENVPTATANTQHVYITDTLSADKFDFSTFRFTGYRIGDTSFNLPPSRVEIFQTTSIKDNNSLKVRFAGTFDTATGIVRCDFYSMDTTGNKLIPDTSLNGFLPPNTDGISGTGNVRYSISAKNLNTLDTFSNKAHIYFDNNAPVATNTWINTVDTTSPTGHIVSAIVVNDTTVKLVVQHGDVGSGFGYNELYAKSGTDTSFFKIRVSSSDTIVFIGIHGQTYQFFTKAVDNVGNRQIKDSVADITVVLNSPLPLTLLSFNGTLTNDKVQLTWITTNEINTSHFDVEQSTDGIHFNKIGVVAAKGYATQNNNYILWDDHPANGNNYYRLKQFDNNGRFSISSTIRIYYGKQGYIVIAPNPAKDYVEINGSSRFTQVQLIDGSGNIIKNYNAVNGNRYSLSGIAKGLYFIKLISKTENQVFKIVIE